MSGGSPQRASQAPRVLRREHDGELVDEHDGRSVTLAELRDDVRAGRRFRVRRAGGGSCTYAVLAEVLTGHEPAIGSAADSRPRTPLEGALLSAFGGHDVDRGEGSRTSGEERVRERRRRRRPNGAPGPPR